MNCLETTLAGIHGGHLLDVGCGAGRFTRQLSERLASVTRIIGIDPDKDSIDEARRETDDRRISYRITSGETMKFSNERFDTVAMSHALHHLAHPDRVLGELSRVLKSGGTLIIEEPVSDTLTPAQENGRDIHHLKAAIDRVKGRSHRSTYSADEVRAGVAQLGFELVADCIDVDAGPVGDDAEDAEVQQMREESNCGAIDFILEYLDHIKGRDEHDELLSEAQALSVKIAESGVESVPRIVIVLRKSVGRDSPPPPE